MALQRTPLFDQHVAAGGKMVDFSGWELAVHYGSLMDEHHAVRKQAGMFDVSHMTVVDITGTDTIAFLRHLLANDINKISTPGGALYGCMLNHDGGVLDDLIVYRMDDSWCRVVVNAATRDKDIAWMQQQIADFDCNLTERDQLAMIAVQGPEARAHAHAVLGPDVAAKAGELKRFAATAIDDVFVARTGYTGEDGYELILPAEPAQKAWEALVVAGVQPCGLGARDSLRLEAGMHLYGHDMDESLSPLECGLAWTVSFTDDRDFIGKAALEKQKAQEVTQKLTGLVLEGRGVLREGQVVVGDAGEGVITSGTFSPTLERSIALARVPKAQTGNAVVQVRKKELPVRLVKPGFVRNGKPVDGVLD